MDYILVLLRWRRFVLYFVLSATILSVAGSFLLPKWYKSTTSLIPPKNQGLLGISGISALLREVVPGATNKLAGQQTAYNYLAIVNSRRAAEAMIQRFGLMEVYGIEDHSVEKAVEEFHDNFAVEVTEEGTVVLWTYDKDSLRAAEMANYMVQILNEISIELATGEAKSNRQFLERRVIENKAELKSVEDAFREFQETHGLVIIPDEARDLASSIGTVYARKLKVDIELSILKKTTGKENPSYKLLEREHFELAKKLSTFPQLGIESFRLYRDIVIQQKIMEFLVPLYEQARIEEQKDIPVILVLDKAVPAEKKSRPKRMLIVASTFLSSLILSIMIVFVLVRIRVFRTDGNERYQQLLSVLKPQRVSEEEKV